VDLGCDNTALRADPSAKTLRVLDPPSRGGLDEAAFATSRFTGTLPMVSSAPESTSQASAARGSSFNRSDMTVNIEEAAAPRDPVWLTQAPRPPHKAVGHGS